MGGGIPLPITLVFEEHIKSIAVCCRNKPKLTSLVAKPFQSKQRRRKKADTINSSIKFEVRFHPYIQPF